jgi:hypothetical protein
MSLKPNLDKPEPKRIKGQSEKGNGQKSLPDCLLRAGKLQQAGK